MVSSYSLRCYRCGDNEVDNAVADADVAHSEAPHPRSAFDGEPGLDGIASRCSERASCGGASIDGGAERQSTLLTRR